MQHVAQHAPKGLVQRLLACIQALIVLGIIGAVMRPFSTQLLHAVEELQISALALPAARDVVQLLRKLTGNKYVHDGNMRAVRYTLAARIVAMLALPFFVAALLAASALWLRAMLRTRRQHRKWTARRRHLALEAALRAGVVLVSLALGTALVATDLGRPEHACSDDAVNVVAASVTHVAAFVLIFLMVLDAHGPAPVKGRPGVVVKDLPYRHHWGKLLLLFASIGASLLHCVPA